MTNEPALTWFLVTTFVMGSVSIWAQFHAIAKLAQWLYSKHREIWRELGRPGTALFKGDPDNPYLRRTSALQAMQRMIPLHAYQRQLGDEVAQMFLARHRVAGIFSIVAMVLFFIGIIYGLVCER